MHPLKQISDLATELGKQGYGFEGSCVAFMCAFIARHGAEAASDYFQEIGNMTTMPKHSQN